MYVGRDAVAFSFPGARRGGSSIAAALGTDLRVSAARAVRVLVVLGVG